MRPEALLEAAFRRMISDIEARRVNMVITKDLSRRR